MNLFMTCSEFGFSDILFIMTTTSTVKDAAQAAADEWNIDVDFIEISFAGEVLSSSATLLSLGVESESQVVVSMMKLFDREWFTDVNKRLKVLNLFHTNPERVFRFDTPSFAVEGCVVISDWQTLHKIEFCNPSTSITSVSDAFLSLSIASELDLTGLKFITEIGNSFLYKQKSLISLNLSVFSSVTVVGDSFVENCYSLSTLNLSGLRNVTSIGNYFLCNCVSIVELDLSPLEKISSIGSYFISGCGSVENLILPDLEGLKSISKNFISGCTSVTSMDLSSLKNITNINDYFLCGCTGVESLDLSSFSSVQSVGRFFLCGCTSVSVNLSGLCDVKSVGPYFMDGCERIAHRDKVDFLYSKVKGLT